MRVTILDDFAITPPLFAQKRWAFAFPNACRLADGTLLVGYRRGKEKHSRDGVFMVQRSVDAGRSWDEPVTVFDGMSVAAPLSAHAGTVVQGADGTALAMFTAVEAGHTGTDYIFSSEGRQLEQHFYVARSDDGGRSWSVPQRAVLPETPALRYINSRPLPLGDGRLVVAVEVTTATGQQAVMSGHYDTTADSFSPFALAAHDATGRLSFGDPKLARRADGALVMWLWAFVNATEETAEAHSSVSIDEGRNWSAPEPTAIRCQAAAVAATPAGELVLAANVRVPPEGIRLWRSAARGTDWSGTPLQMWDARRNAMLGVPLEVALPARDPSDGQLWQALPGFSFGSPDLVPADADSWVLSYYAVNDSFAEVRICRFGLD